MIWQLLVCSGSIATNEGINMKVSVQLRNSAFPMTKLAARWNTLTEAQQEELAQTIAGVRRKSFFLNLMQNFDLVL